MAKGIAKMSRTVSLMSCEQPTVLSDVCTADVNVGTARNGLLILNMSASTSDLNLEDVSLGVSETSDNFSTGTEVAVSDRAGLIQHVSDSYAALTIASDQISVIDTGQASTYVFNVENLKQYATLQYTSMASDAFQVSAVLVGLDLEDAPYAADTSAYSAVDGGAFVNGSY